MWILVVIGLLHVGVSVACFVAFYAFLHLGWTVFSNQICILTMNSVFDLYATLTTKTAVKIKHDQQQVRITIRYTTDDLHWKTDTQAASLI